MTSIFWTGLLAVWTGLFQANPSPIPTDTVELSDTALGTVRAAAPGRIHTEEAVKGAPRAVIVELK